MAVPIIKKWEYMKMIDVFNEKIRGLQKEIEESEEKKEECQSRDSIVFLKREACALGRIRKKLVELWRAA